MREKEFLPLVAERLGITELNPMQRQMMATASEQSDVILLSPTGSGKTLAFILPMLKRLNPPTTRVQAIVIAPSRELVIQIAEIIRQIANKHKTVALYGGHKVEDEVNSLTTSVPDIIVSTPGRLLDHINRRNIDVMPSRILVLDEFDKSLELGFEDEMTKIMRHLKNVSRKILTSATNLCEIPDFVSLQNVKTISFLDENAQLRQRLKVTRVNSSSKDKLLTLQHLLLSLSQGKNIERTIIFVNYRESAIRIADFLNKLGASTALYHGALRQVERETAIATFNNGSTPILIATDLAARGLDIEAVANIIHYHLPLSPEAYTHRNGRSARVDASGCVYIILAPGETTQDYISFDHNIDIEESATPSKNQIKLLRSPLTSLYIAAGKKEKISKGDVAGFLIKQGGLEMNEVGKINSADHYTIVAIPADKAPSLLPALNAAKLKGTRYKIHIIK